MEEVFNLESYRRELENFYVWPYDEDKYQERKAKIDKISDDTLNKIIEDTKQFCSFILDKQRDEIENDDWYGSDYFTEFGYDGDQMLSNGCGGGYPCDILFHPVNFAEDFYISERLLKSYLKGYRIEEDSDVETVCDDDVYVDYVHYKLVLVISQDDYNNLYGEKSNKQKKKS